MRLIKIPRRWFLCSVIALAASAGCTSILGITDGEEYTPPPEAAAATNPYPDAPLVVPTPVQTGESGACTANTQSDISNCGICNHACGGTQCRGGICDPEPLATFQIGQTIDKLLVVGDAGFFSVRNDSYGQNFTVYYYMFQIYRFDATKTSTPAVLENVFADLDFNQTTSTGWFADFNRVYGWEGVPAYSYAAGTTGYFMSLPSEFPPDASVIDSGVTVDAAADGAADSGPVDAGIVDARTTYFKGPPTTGFYDDPAIDGGIVMAPGTTNESALISFINETDSGVPLQFTFGHQGSGHVDFLPMSTGFVYGTNAGLYTLPRVCEAGSCPLTALATGTPSLCGLMADGENIRWCGTEINPVTGKGRLLLRETSPNATTIELNGVDFGSNSAVSPLPIAALDARGLYYVEGDRIALLPLNGPIVTMAITETPVRAITISGPWLYWIEQSAIYRVAK